MVDLSFATNNITLYSYEPFSYTISNPVGGSSTLSTTRTSGIPPSYLTNNGNVSVTFGASSNAMTVGTQQFIVSVLAADVSQTLLGTSTNNVTISPGRFVDGSGGSLVGSNYTFYAKEAITPIKLVAPFNIGTPTSTPSLPPGLGFSSVDGSSVSIIGTPLVTAPQSNYLIIGKQVGSSKVVSSIIPFVISNERISTNLAGGNIISGMQIGTAITPRTLTAKGNGTIRYTWAALPDGLAMTDISGNVQPFNFFVPTDPSYTMIIQGTPTLAAATAFKDANYSTGVTQSILVERINPLPLISSLVPIRYAFGETVLFNTVSNSTLYTDVSVSPTPATSFYAATYFTSNVDISSIFSPNLRLDLSLAYSGNSAFLTGAPTSAGTASYTIRAINSNGTTQDATTTISVVNDFVTFSIPPPSAVDACYNFVLSRPVDLSLSGYYPTPIQFSASAASGRTITWSAPALSGTGLSLSATTGDLVSIVGTPSNITSLQTLAVTASVSSASGTRNAQFQIINDVFTFASVGSLSFIQNKPITPVQFTASALSGRQVTSYSATGLPLGLSLSTTGRLSGTPLTNTLVPATFTLNVSTGFTNGSQPFSYTIAPDNILLVVTPQSSYPLSLGGSVPPATIKGLTYSGGNVSNYVFSNLSPTYGLTINSTTGVFGGTFTTSIPPQDVLPSNVNFSVNALAGTLDGSLSVAINTINPPAYNWFTLTGNTIGRTSGDFNHWTSITSGLTCNAYSDYSLRQLDLTSQVIVAVTGDAYYVRSLDGVTFIDLSFSFVDIVSFEQGDGFEEMVEVVTTIQPGASKIVSVPNTTTLYGVGSYSGQGYFFKSTNDGGTWTTQAATADSPYGFALQTYDSTAIAYKDGTILLGGSTEFPFAGNPTVYYSTNGGSTFAASSSAMVRTSYVFSVEGTRWIVGGSDVFAASDSWTDSSTPTRTLRYSDNQGVSWSLVSDGEFNYKTEFIVRGNGLWIAGGQQGDLGEMTAYFALRYSTDGDYWSSFTLPGSWNPTQPIQEGYTYYNNDYIDSINYDGENYNIVISRFGVFTSSKVVFQHAADGSSLTSGWSTVTNNLVSLSGGPRTSGLKGRILVSIPPVTSTLNFPSQAGSGPTITSPASSSYLLYQYIPITPIQLSATGTGTTYFFLLSEQLPPGLSFDPLTNQITGTPPQTGQYSTTIYAKDDNGITEFTISFKIILASYIRQQTSAGAWTSLIRQYTEVNAATTARDNKATPAIDYRLGEFTSPDPPSVITPDPNCKC